MNGGHLSTSISWEPYILQRPRFPKAENNYGRIINIASVAGVYGNANMAHYSATKGALIAMTKALAKEVAEKGILVKLRFSRQRKPERKPRYELLREKRAFLYGADRDGHGKRKSGMLSCKRRGKLYFRANIQIDGCRKKQ